MAVRDRGYAWVILFAATLIQAFSISTTMGAIGSMYVEMLNYFPGTSKTTVSWMASIQICTLGIIGRPKPFIYLAIFVTQISWEHKLT